MSTIQTLEPVSTSPGQKETEDISLADLEGSRNEILRRVAERVRHGDTVTDHGSHSSHGSSHHTSSS